MDEPQFQFYIIDTETTGLNSAYNEITEVSIIRCADRMQMTLFVKCEYPERASIDALAITNKTLADLEKGDTKEVAASKIIEFIEQDGQNPDARCYIGHNVNFDRKFMHALHNKTYTQCPVNYWLCTMNMAKLLLKTGVVEESKIIKTATGKISTKLHPVCDMLNIKKRGTAHSSKMDTQNTYLLWKKLVDEYKFDYTPHIKSFPHIVESSIIEDEALMESLDL